MSTTTARRPAGLEQHALAPTCAPGEALRELLAAYSQAIALARELPPIVWLRQGDGRLRRRLRLPYPRSGVERLVLLHARRSTDLLKRRCYENLALGATPDEATRNIALLETWERSLPPTRPYRAAPLMVAIGTFFVAYLLANFVIEAVQAEFLGELTTAIVDLDRGEIIDVLSRSDFELGQWLATIPIILCSLWIVLRPAIVAFRVKRMLFCLHPTFVERRATSSVGDRPGGTDGIYRLEARTFDVLGARAPRELALDLVGRALLVGSLGVAGSVAVVYGGVGPEEGVWFALCAGAGCRLIARWRRRRPGAPANGRSRWDAAGRYAYCAALVMLALFFAIPA